MHIEKHICLFCSHGTDQVYLLMGISIHIWNYELCRSAAVLGIYCMHVDSFTWIWWLTVTGEFDCQFTRWSPPLMTYLPGSIFWGETVLRANTQSPHNTLTATMFAKHWNTDLGKSEPRHLFLFLITISIKIKKPKTRHNFLKTAFYLIISQKLAWKYCFALPSSDSRIVCFRYTQLQQTEDETRETMPTSQG